MQLKSIGARVLGFHEAIRVRYPRLCRIAVALYNPAEETLETFASSTWREEPFSYYVVPLADVPSLQRLKQDGERRIIDDFSIYQGSASLHTQSLLRSGVRSSCTVPMTSRSEFLGFIFFDADQPRYFSEPVLTYVELYAQLITALVAHDLSSIRTLRGAVTTAREFSRFRDAETADHLARMAHYCRIVARAVCPRLGHDEEYIEFLYQFAPLHDIGKVAVPDRILLKPGALEGEDLAIMRAHVTTGVDIVDTMVREFGFSQLHNVDILRNLVATHHEHFDGTGYPAGLAGDDLPLEGRIVAVADVFDALTSERPYKSAWTFDEALAYLGSHAGTKFDPDCVAAVRDHIPAFRKIYERFAEDRY